MHSMFMCGYIGDSGTTEQLRSDSIECTTLAGSRTASVGINVCFFAHSIFSVSDTCQPGNRRDWLVMHLFLFHSNLFIYLLRNFISITLNPTASTVQRLDGETDGGGGSSEMIQNRGRSQIYEYNNSISYIIDISTDPFCPGFMRLFSSAAASQL